MTENTLPQVTHRRRFQGLVTRAVLPKTITVRVERRFRHPRVGRVVRTMRKFLVHDATGTAHEGDTVLIEETRPLSRLKRWRLIEVLSMGTREKDDGGDEEQDAGEERP